jgi:hypothetical protein
MDVSGVSAKIFCKELVLRRRIHVSYEEEDT